MWRLLTIVTLLPILAQGAAFKAVSDAIPQLTNLTLTSPSRYLHQLGGMNMTHCCLLAVNSSFGIKNGNISIINTSFLSTDTTPASFLTSINEGQFPCGAEYNGDLLGAPPVKSTYRWCKSNCNGWQISQAKKLQQWVGPMVSFILPSLVFCINIPKRREIDVSDRLFQHRAGSQWAFISTPARFLVAVVMVSIDTLIWLALCFVFAAPMILSGIYEAFWDHKILKFLSVEGGKLPVEIRARLLYVVLVGNIDLNREETVVEDDGGAWEDVQKLTSGENVSGEKAICRTQTRLLSMLRTQSSFASAVGAPIVFFAGGFAYTIADTRTNLGDNDTAHALAFGMWWMIMPHVAIISSLLLASNNPNTFQGIVGGPVVVHPAVFKIFGLAYPSRYKTEWMWFRGRSKFLWIQKTLQYHNFENASLELNLSANLSLLEWKLVTILTFVLIAVPVALAFLISYYTPNIGVSCRSVTFAVYLVTQSLQLALWVWVLKTSTVCPAGKLHSPMRWTRNTRWNAYRCFVWWTLATIFGIASIFTSIGGTIMQLLGVYRNCLCALPIQYWRNPDAADSYIALGTNTADDIMAAKTWWIGIGGVAITFLCLNCYWGWWYQRRLRGVFQDVVEKCLVS
ncbi:hypothetical protein D0Z07_6488 [Hyphodiscus hymeniophilus]|uniref:Uncharacterized protein n=1 Tax=Hyphodiscus hymeniophilus TaxID=353542 RepID=A0A9P7AUX6_9HELO|nr:hypothetical protein D0Z07_6488 [Hyphodiscus hymeniophilus]